MLDGYPNRNLWTRMFIDRYDLNLKNVFHLHHPSFTLPTEPRHSWQAGRSRHLHWFLELFFRPFFNCHSAGRPQYCHGCDCLAIWLLLRGDPLRLVPKINIFGKRLTPSPRMGYTVRLLFMSSGSSKVPCASFSHRIHVLTLPNKRKGRP